MSISYDVSDFLEFAADCERAADMVPQVLHDTAFEAGTLVHQRALANVAPHRKTGTLETHLGPAEVKVSGNTARAEVAAKAVSGTGFPYPVALEEGRDAKVMPKGKYMVFPGKDGKTVFARRTKAVAGIKFMQRALDDSKPEIDATVKDATDRLLDPLRGR